MKKIGIQLLIFIITIKTFSQTSNYSIEINPFIRYDKQRYFFSWETVLGGKNYVSPRGLSFGININIQKQINNRDIAFIGAGFYKHAITNIKRYNDNTTGNDRLINYPSPLFIPFFTERYKYTCLSVNAGYKRSIKLNNDFFIDAGIDVSGLYTFSQQYHLTSNPGGSTKYIKSKSGFWGIMGSLDIGFIKSFGKFNIGPNLIIPVLASLKTDVAFPNENGTDFRQQWFSGIGSGVSFIYKLKNIKK